MSYRDQPRRPVSRWLVALAAAMVLAAVMWSDDAEAAIVLGELELTFEDAIFTHSILTTETAFDALASPLTLWDLSIVDLPTLTSLWGPLLDISWSVKVSPTLAPIPLPGSVWGLLGGLFMVAWRIRPHKG